MKTNLKYTSLILVAITLLLVITVVMTNVGVSPVAAGKATATKTSTSTPSGPTATPAPATNYYVDCSAATNGSGTQASPWNNLSTVNGHTFVPGDQILFKRGVTCTGQLWPKGSGVSGNPITASAYGSGARPVIDGNNAVAPVVTIKDQNYWTFDSLEIKNSTGLVLYVNGTVGASLYGFTLTNLYVHNGGMNDGQQLVQVGMYQGHSVHNVLIDNVEASTGWRGIEIGGPSPLAGASRSSNITIRNANIHDVQSDGILMASSNNAVTENSVVYNSGIMSALQNHTPNGLWTWDCDDCVVQFNEVYWSHSPSWDGGAFDIDYFNHRNTVQYNYGHDNDAYCFAAFGGDRGDVTTTNVIRYNICSNDARDGGLADNRNGAIYMSVWSGGTVQDTYIYNNTVYYNPAGAHSAINIVNMGGSAINNTNIYNNIIYSTSANLVKIAAFNTQTNMDYNLYWYTGAGNPSFVWGSTIYTSFAAWKTGSGQDAHGLYTNPMLNDPTYHGFGKPVTSFIPMAGSPVLNAGADLVALGKVTSMGTHDFFGDPIPVGGAYDIGAIEGTSGPTPTPGPSPTPTLTSTPVPTSTSAPGGTNLALNKSVMVSDSASGNPGTNAVDGSQSTYWRTLANSTALTEWITVNLVTPTNISQVVLYWNSGRRPTNYTIQVSQDNINWTTVATVTNGSGVTDTLTFTTVSARYVQMNSTAWANSSDHVRIQEFQIYQ